MVRKDLPVPVQCVQACHAAIEATKYFLTKEAAHPHLVVCEVRGEHKLCELMKKLDRAGVNYRQFSEPGVGVTAVATEPLCGKQRDVFSKYQLLKGEQTEKFRGNMSVPRLLKPEAEGSIPSCPTKLRAEGCQR